MKNRRTDAAKAGEPCQDGNVAALSLKLLGVSVFRLFDEGFMIHNYEVKVFHADTDCYGIVWHGTYLRFCEQARCEFAASAGLTMKEIEGDGILLPLIEVNIKYKHSAKVHDTLLITTTVEHLSPIRATMLQKIINKETGKDVAIAEITFVCTDENGNLYRKMPEKMFNLLKEMKDS